MSTLKHIHKIVFPAAGLGSRMLPATLVLPKELLPVVDKPIIQYGVEEAVASGFTEAILVHSPGQTLIQEHLSLHPKLEERLEQHGKSAWLSGLHDLVTSIKFSTATQKEPLGLGHAVLTSRELVGNDPFAVLLADDLIDANPPALQQMLAVFADMNGPVLLVERVPREAVERYGVIDGELIGDRLYRVNELVEKPDPNDTPSDLAIIGRYLLTPDIYPALSKTGHGAGGEIQLTDGLRCLLKQRPIYAVELTGVRQDAGTKLGYLRAILHFAAKRPEFADRLFSPQ